jgi:hypothetical protein
LARKLVIAELTPKFPDFLVALVVADGLTIAANRSATLEREIAEAEARCRERWSGVELSAIPAVATWRAAYRAFGIKKTSYRSSFERLIKRVLAGDGLPNINALVDLYNMISTTWSRSNPAFASAATISTPSREISLSASRGRATHFSTWARATARTRWIRPRMARSSTPTQTMSSAGAGTGARTRARCSLRGRGAPYPDRAVRTALARSRRLPGGSSKECASSAGVAVSSLRTSDADPRILNPAALAGSALKMSARGST